MYTKIHKLCAYSKSQYHDEQEQIYYLLYNSFLTIVLSIMNYATSFSKHSTLIHKLIYSIHFISLRKFRTPIYLLQVLHWLNDQTKTATDCFISKCYLICPVKNQLTNFILK